ADETAEGRSIVTLARDDYRVVEPPHSANATTFIPFSAQTRLSGVDVEGRRIRKGAVDAVLRFVGLDKAQAGDEFNKAVDAIARSGGTPLAVAEADRLLGVVHLKDVVKPGIKERFAELRAMGIRTV